MDSATKDYMTCADTAKLVRAALVRHFPGVKFSVTSKTYSGGASIRVHWTDGPRTKAVDAITRAFSGASFDPMQDLKTYHSTVVVGENGPRVIHYGADHVFCSRTVTDEERKRAEAEAMIRSRCGLDDEGRFGMKWPHHLAADMVYDTDYREDDAVERAFRRVVLNRED